MVTGYGFVRGEKVRLLGMAAAVVASVAAQATAEPLHAPARMTLSADAGAPARSGVLGGGAVSGADQRDGAENREWPGAFRATLKVKLAPGWKTFWRSPGEAGIPPHFDWTGSENVASVEIVWPSPHAFEAFGFRMYGYEGEVSFPIVVTPAASEAAATLNASVLIAVCEQVCVPVAGTFSLGFDPGEDVAAARGSAAEGRATALGRVPETGEDVEALLVSCGVAAPEEGSARLNAEIAPEARIRPRLALVEAGDGSGVVREAGWRQGADGGWLIDAEAPGASGDAASSSPILTVIGEERALEFRECGAKEPG